MGKPDLKQRAERAGKIRRTIARIEQTVAKLERMKEEYLDKAVAAKSRGDSASYSLAKSGLNATLTQIKRAKEMLLNIEITAELQRMGETNADFLTGMSTIAKSISKINKQSDFVKLQKEINKALSGMEEAQAGLDGFLQNTDAQFAAISQSPGALTDRQIDELVAGKVSEREILMDDQLDSIIRGNVAAAPKAEQAPRVDISVGAPTPPTQPTVTVTPMAKPFPSPTGAFRFEPGSGSPLSPNILGDDMGIGVPLKNALRAGAPAMIIGMSADGAVHSIKLSDAPGALVGGVIGSGKSVFVHQLLCSLAVMHSAAEVKFLLVDTDGEELNEYNGMPHMVCNTINSAAEILPALGAVEREMEKRYAAIGAAGVRNVTEYNAAGGKFPYIVVVFDEIAAAVAACGDEFGRTVSRIMSKAQAAGVFVVLATRSVNADTLTPDITSAARVRIAFKTDAAGAAAMEIPAAADIAGAGSLVYSLGGETVACAAPYIDQMQVKRVAAAAREDVL